MSELVIGHWAKRSGGMGHGLAQVMGHWALVSSQ